MKDIQIEMTDIQPLEGMSLGQLIQEFTRLANTYGSGAVCVALRHRGNNTNIQLELPGIDSGIDSVINE